MRRGNRDDVVVRPKTKARKRAPATPKSPALAELAARVAWLEECQRVNVMVGKEQAAQLKWVTEQRRHEIARAVADLQASIFASIRSAAAIPPTPEPHQRRRWNPTLKGVLTVVVAAILIVGVSLLLAWLT